MTLRNQTAFTLSLVALGLSLVASLLFWMEPALAQQGGEALAPDVIKWGFITAAAATGISSLAAGYAVAVVASAAVGALAEKPELLGRVLVLVGLAEGIAIYGLIISILILNRVAA